MTPFMRFAVWSVRSWTRAYTWRLPAPLRDARRAEIDSDLWELLQDQSTGQDLNPALHVLLRLVLGVADDLRWRASKAPLARKPLRRAAGAALIATLLGVVWLMAEIMGPQHLPQAPATPLRFVAGPPPGPPPPPPPPPPRPRLRR